MKIIFNPKFYQSYTADNAAKPGRMEVIMQVIEKEPSYSIVSNESADEKDIVAVHESAYIDKIKADSNLYEMAALSAGGAILAAQLGMQGQPAFACIRPPGHHAYRSSGWGYCYFCNMAIALKKLKTEGKINSAFLLDFDAHTGDGTRDCLSDWKGIRIFNPMAATRQEYMKLVENTIKETGHVDLIAVSAGFDSYKKDVGQKLDTFDFYQMGYLLKKFANRCGHQRRFAILEGGYYLPDLGKNVLAFCQGFE
ncbi:MAG: histone deacetylase family protein [Fidelibacterota bacterium]